MSGASVIWTVQKMGIEYYSRPMGWHYAQQVAKYIIPALFPTDQNLQKYVQQE